MKYSCVPLGGLVTISGGGTPSRNNDTYWGGSISWATVKDLKDTTLSGTQETITPEGLRDSASNLIPAGSVIVATRMSLGKVAINTIDVTINQDLKAFSCGANLEPRYLLYFLLANASHLDSMGKGATVKGITLDVLKDLSVPLPPLPEQKRIAAILNNADSIRRKRQEAVRLTEELLRSVFLDMFGDPVTNPKGWEEAALTDVAEIVSGVTKGRKLDGKQTVLAPYLRVANVQDGYLNLSEIKEIEVLPSEIAKYRLFDGDILLTEGGDPDKLGRGTVWRAHIEDCIHQNHIFRVRIKTDKLLPDFLSVLIGSERGKRYFLRAAKQTTGIASINSTQLKNFPVLIPSMGLQKRFAESIVSTQKLKKRLIETENATDTLFISLLQRAFKGEL